MRNFLLLIVLFANQSATAQSFDPSYYNSMQWRCIGPHRGGRTVGAVGIPRQPNVFFIGVSNGGVWKTIDYGRTWVSIFDDQPTGSVGDIVVAPANPNIIYVGSGEGLQRPDLSVGDGIYKTVDGGKTWSNTGLKEAQQIGGMAIDPLNENRVFAAALGHPYGPNKERGVYRTVDGAKSWQQVLYIDENTGAVQVTIDPENSSIVYASMWAGRQGPWENGAWNGKESGLFKSTDGGTTWRKLMNGLPGVQQGLGRIGFCLSPSDTKRMYATVDAVQSGGIYRSDDAGENWYIAATDNRYWGRGSDFAELKTDPTNADIVYTVNVATWKSTDGGKTWNEFRGAPGGDDYHRIWINPTNPEIILLAGDQGAIITVNGGQTFSSWYNQPTAQFYHVSTDNSFPYMVYGGQQESGSVGVASRGNDGQIGYREWHPVGVEEYGYVAADPLDNNIIYGGKITRFNKRTGQVQNIAPESVRSGKYRFLRTAPVLFSPLDPKTLYFAGNVLFKTRDEGNSWQVISPDLTRENWEIPGSVGIYTNDEMKKMPRRGVIYTIAPSFLDMNTIWAGTDDGLIHVTKDGGKTWKNVTPPTITSWSKVSLMEASHSDINTAYAAVNRIRCDDMKPHIYKTTDGGRTWKEIVNGLPDDPVNAVREDPKRKGLLFAGSERAVYISFDDGEHWQSLRLNMPATSIRDLVIKDDDIVVGTHGRSFWILDDISPLRQLSNSIIRSTAILFKPQAATRVRWSMYTDTPVPQEEASGKNPPDGAIINYYISETAREVSLEIKDGKGMLIRKYSNKDTFYKIPTVNFPQYWIRPQQILSVEKGSHRFLWDMKYEPLDIIPSYPISAIYKNTEPGSTAPWVMPGKYIARLTVDGREFLQSFTVRMDPRVKATVVALQQQHDLSIQCYSNRKQCKKLFDEIGEVQGALNQKMEQASNAERNRLENLNKEIGVLQNSSSTNSSPGLSRLNVAFSSLFNQLEEVDNPPTTQLITAIKTSQADFDKLKARWQSLKKSL